MAISHLTDRKKQQVIFNTLKYVESTLEGEPTGHDWWHSYRVWKMAKRIAAKEHADTYVVQLAAILHDIADYKLHGGDEEIGPRTARKWLESQGVDEGVTSKVCFIVRNMNYQGALGKSIPLPIEGMVVRDADWLDAIGAIGVARTFAYGGFHKRPMYDPKIRPVMHRSAEEYKKGGLTTINHFYEKLLLLREKMSTKTGKQIAFKRERFMREYLARFFAEWDGKL
jgi:uncharacterized protein